MVYINPYIFQNKFLSFLRCGVGLLGCLPSPDVENAISVRLLSDMCQMSRSPLKMMPFTLYREMTIARHRQGSFYSEVDCVYGWQQRNRLFQELSGFFMIVISGCRHYEGKLSAI